MELRFNRVELIVRPDEIEAARQQFNDLIGLRLPTPHHVSGGRALSATDFDGFIELVAPIDDTMPLGVVLAEHGAGQIGPLVWEVDDLEEARQWLAERDLRIVYEYDSTTGNEEERAANVKQFVLDKSQWFGFVVTLMQRNVIPPG
jgi:hypothetical protein